MTYTETAEPPRRLFTEPIVELSVTCRSIIDEVAHKHGLTAQKVLSYRQFAPLVRARQEAMYRAVNETTLSLPQIGRAFGGRDHTTIGYGATMHAIHNGLPLSRGVKAWTRASEVVRRRRES